MSRLDVDNPTEFLTEQGLGQHTVAYDRAFLELYAVLDDGHRLYQSFREAINLYRQAKRAQMLPGSVAEVGVYKGGTAKLLAATMPDKEIYLFDTFGGMPETAEGKDTFHRQGDFQTDLKDVQDYLVSYPNVRFFPGFFPDTAKDLDSSFCLVHLDADIYQTTLDGLKYFYPRLVKGGRIVLHDYSRTTCPGVKAAVDEYFADKDQEVIELWDTQGLIICA